MFIAQKPHKNNNNTGKIQNFIKTEYFLDKRQMVRWGRDPDSVFFSPL